MKKDETNKFSNLEIEGDNLEYNTDYDSPTEWIENNFHYQAKTGRNEPLPKTSLFSCSSITHKKIFYLSFIFIATLLVIFYKIFYLQIINGNQNRILAEKNRQRSIPITAERGTIYDRNGIALTQNIPKFSIALTPQDLPTKTKNREEIVRRLAQITEQSTQTIRDILKEYGSYSYESIIIKENIDYEKALSLQIESSDLPGIHIERGSKRLYLFDKSLSHILGYQGKLDVDELNNLYLNGYLPSDYIGKSGIEKTYETNLRGKYGHQIIEVDAAGKKQAIIEEIAPIPGMHLKLSIDKKIQDKLEELISNSLEKNKKERASGIVMNPNNGEILALVSLPSYNNNDFSGGITNDNYQKYITNINHPLFNRAISGEYPSGSVIKPAISAAALTEGIITGKTSFLSTGGLETDDHFFPDWLAGGHGITNVTKAIAWSVNTFFYYIGGGYKDFEGLGVEKIVSYLQKFGFNQKLGIDLPAEATGFLPSKTWKEKTKNEKWYIGDTYNLSIGQGDLLVTPLQIATMTATIANGGNIYTPRVVKAMIDPITNKTSEIEPKLISKKIIPQEYLEIVRRGMRDCVTIGSCQLLANLPIKIAGKTGTAQWSNNKENHAWFTSFAPYDNPQIVVTVIVEEGGEGSKVAMPIVNQFYQWWLTANR